MRPTRGTIVLTLFLAFGSVLPARGDDTAPVQQGTQGTQRAAQTLPPEVETDLREKISELDAEVAQLKKDVADLKALQQKDDAAFQKKLAEDEAKIAQLEKQQGVTGRVGQVNGQIAGERRGTPNGAGTTNANGTNGSGTRPGTTATTGARPGTTTGTNQNKPLTFWQQLLLGIVKGLAQGLQHYVDQRLGIVRNNAYNASQRLGQRYPTHSNQIDNRIRDAVNGSLGQSGWGVSWPNNGSVATPPFNGGAPVFNGGVNGSPVYGSQVNGSQVNGTTVVQQNSQTVVMQNGQVVQVTNTSTTQTNYPVRQVPRLPVVTDEFGTHPVINLALGVGD